MDNFYKLPLPLKIVVITFTLLTIILAFKLVSKQRSNRSVQSTGTKQKSIDLKEVEVAITP